MHKIREDLFAYLRASLMQKKEQSHKQHLLISTPVDPDFELLVTACAINLLQGLLTARFKTSIEEDEQILARSDISMRVRFAVMHRVDCKRILTSNINILNILVRILAKLQFASEEAANMGERITREIYKAIYMSRVEDFEIEEQVLMNRIRIRKYLRELLLNQKRVMETLTKQGLTARKEAS